MKYYLVSCFNSYTPVLHVCTCSRREVRIIDPNPNLNLSLRDKQSIREDGTLQRTRSKSPVRNEGTGDVTATSKVSDWRGESPHCRIPVYKPGCTQPSYTAVVNRGQSDRNELFLRNHREKIKRWRDFEGPCRFLDEKLTEGRYITARGREFRYHWIAGSDVE